MATRYPEALSTRQLLARATSKRRFSDRHPLLVAFAVSLIAGFVLLFSF